VKIAANRFNQGFSKILVNFSNLTVKGDGIAR
jgi:hypothetical protein